jgi:hypothetical protein
VLVAFIDAQLSLTLPPDLTDRVAGCVVVRPRIQETSEELL